MYEFFSYFIGQHTYISLFVHSTTIVLIVGAFLPLTDYLKAKELISLIFVTDVYYLVC